MHHTLKSAVYIKINPCCVRLNKCSFPKKYRVSQNYVNTNGLWYHLFPAKCVSGL